MSVRFDNVKPSAFPRTCLALAVLLLRSDPPPAFMKTTNNLLQDPSFLSLSNSWHGKMEFFSPMERRLADPALHIRRLA
jgi:hypothetical protein